MYDAHFINNYFHQVQNVSINTSQEIIAGVACFHSGNREFSRRLAFSSHRLRPLSAQ